MQRKDARTGDRGRGRRGGETAHASREKRKGVYQRERESERGRRLLLVLYVLVRSRQIVGFTFYADAIQNMGRSH